MSELKWTGERLVTSVADIHGAIEHLHRYALALELANQMRVLDIASGEGYGSNILSQVAKHVVGVDISEESIAHAKKKYIKSNLEFKVGSTSNIPLADNSIDVVVSFETLEHHDEHDNMVREIKRVLTPNGILILSSPEKAIYKERDPVNPFHIKELTLLDFESLLKRYFRNIQIFDQRFVFGTIINELGVSNGFHFYDGDYTGIKKTLDNDKFYNRPFFNLAIATDGYNNCKVPSTSFFNGLRVLEKEKQALQNEVTKIKASYSFRIAYLLVRPFSRIKSILRRKW